MKKILLIAMVLIATTNTKAQEKKIKGRVVEQLQDGSEVSIPGANVYWEGTTIGVATNSEGYYLIPSPKKYPSTMVVSYVGYQAYSQEITEWSHYHIYLKPSVELGEVKVKGKVNTTKFSTINTINMQTLSTGELEKAACCNLSESFSTNATVDVTFTDAVSGAKKIQMLGLDGVYTQITQENIPLIRGMTSTYGLSYVPGTWIESIQIIKGAGSVVNGFESFAGQINLEYYKPKTAPKLFWNAYTNSEGKLENNLLFAKKSGKWTSNLFTHISYFDLEVNNNNDDFLDMPKTKQINVLNRWDYASAKYHIGLTGRALVEDRVGGTKEGVTNPFEVNIHNDLIEFTSKTGAILPSTPGKCMGIQTSFRRHNQTAIFGKNDYKGLQESAYFNFIRQTYIATTNHKLKYGISNYTDRYTESFSGRINSPLSGRIRTDLVSGFFSEYAYKWGESFNLVAGVRGDYYNKTEEVNYLPRLNMKYNPSESTAIRFSVGKAFRIANVLVENASFLASSRTIEIASDLKPEIAWNYGANLTHCFKLFGREGTFNADAYRTEFENKIVVDIETPGKLSFSNLEGTSYANSMQVDLAYELFNQFDVKLAYKVNDVITTFNSEDKIAPLSPKNRGLFNISYATNFDKWVFDVTANYVGESRVPIHKDKNLILVAENFSDPFYLYNAQVTKKFRKFAVYLGGENLLSEMQENPIIDAKNPNSDAFDASLIYAPVMGTVIYAGLRYKIK